MHLSVNIISYVSINNDRYFPDVENIKALLQFYPEICE